MYFSRLLQPIIFGVASNLLVNFIFDPVKPDLDVQEFAMAIILFIPITEFNRLLDIRLNKHYNWLSMPLKRLGYHLLFLLIFTTFILNVLGNTYLLIIGSGFFSIKQLIIITITSFTLSVFLTALNWASYYYDMWKQSEQYRHESKKRHDEVINDLKKSADSITCSKGNHKIMVPIESIAISYITLGIVQVEYGNRHRCIYNEPLKNLFELLPNHQFFMANRNTIINKGNIKSYTSSSYGKIEVNLKSDKYPKIYIPRQRAAAYRKWYSQ